MIFSVQQLLGSKVEKAIICEVVLYTMKNNLAPAKGWILALAC